MDFRYNTELFFLFIADFFLDNCEICIHPELLSKSLIFLQVSDLSKITTGKYFLLYTNFIGYLREGPCLKLTYNKKYLPVIILDKSETWRKIKDFENNSGWIHISQLSKKKSAINIKKNSILFKKSTIYSKPIAQLEIGRLVLIKKCKREWCKISSGNYVGWIFKNTLWGKL